jgi:hypothetical protein
VHPLAVVVLGGLVSSTFVTLVLIPVLYLRFGFGARPDQAARPRRGSGRFVPKEEVRAAQE